MMGQIGDTVHSDLDFFKFKATAGDVLNIKLVNGQFATIVAVFDEAGNIARQAMGAPDARIDMFVAPATATYTVAVSTGMRYFVDGGNVLSFFGTTTTDVGPYTLNISGASVAQKTMQINIQVKPGSNELAPLNPKSQGKVPVAIMGAAGFDVSNIKQNTLSFGSTGNEKSLSKCQKVTRDINHDGYADKLCHFENNLAGFKSGDIEGVLKGTMAGGASFEGRSVLKVLPSRRK